MAWTMLFIAGLLEIVWATALKYSNGFSNLWPSVIFVAAAALSFVCLSYALKTIPMGNAYAIWGGIGAVGIAVVGIVWFGEPLSIVRAGCILLIIAGIVGLKMFGAETRL